MKRRTFISMCLAVVIMFTAGMVSAGEKYDGDLSKLRYQYGKIRAEFIFYNNSGVHINNVKVQVALLDKNGKAICVQRTWLSNIPDGSFESSINLFWEGTSENDLKRVDQYSWRITYIK